jgi:hypothetical protein
MPKTLQLELEETNNLESFLQDKKHWFSKTIAEFLCWALENNVDSFIFAEVAVPYPDDDAVEVIRLGCKREEYLDACEKQLKNLIEFEEYEMCPKLQEWIDYLKIERKVKK